MVYAVVVLFRCVLDNALVKAQQPRKGLRVGLSERSAVIDNYRLGALQGMVFLFKILDTLR